MVARNEIESFAGNNICVGEAGCRFSAYELAQLATNDAEIK